MVCKRKYTGQQSPGQRSGLDSSMTRKKQRTGREVCSRENGQLQGESSKSGRAVITEVLDDEVVKDKSQLQQLRSEAGRKTKKPRTNKEMWSRQHGQLRGETFKRERVVRTDKLDNEIIVDENLLELFRSESNTRTRKQRTNKEMLPSGHEQLQRQASKRGGGPVTGTLDGEVVIDENQLELFRSESSMRTRKQTTNKEMLSSGHEQLQRQTSKRGRGPVTGTLDDEVIVDENKLERLRSESNTRTRKQRTSKETLSSEHGKLPRQTSKRAGGLVTGTLDDEVVIDKRQPQSLISESSVRTKKQRTDKETRFHEHGLPQRETNREGTVVEVKNVVDGMVGSESQVTDSTSDQVHLASNSKETLPSEHHQPQPETNEETGTMTVNKGMVVNSENKLVSSRSSVHLHDFSKTKESLLCKHQELQKEACDQISAMAENGPGEMVVDQDEDPDLSLSSRKSSQVHLWSENKGALPNDHQLTLTGSLAAGCCSQIRLQTVVNGTAVEPERTLSSNRSGKCQPRSENKDILAGQCRRLQEETVNQIFVDAENFDARTAAEQSHGPDPRLSASTSGHPVHLRSENKELLLTDQRASVTENQNQEQDLVLGKSGQVHVRADQNIELSSSEYPELQEERSNQADRITENYEEEVVMDQCQEPDPILESNKSGQVQLRAENIETLPREHPEPQEATSNRVDRMTENHEEEVVMDQCQEPDPILELNKSGQVQLRTENVETLSSEHPEPQEATSNRVDRMTENHVEEVVMDQCQEPDPILELNKSGQVQLRTENVETLSSEHPEPQEATSNRVDRMTENHEEEVNIDHCQEPDPSLESNTPGQVQLRSDNKKTFALEHHVQTETNDQRAAMTGIREEEPQAAEETSNQTALRIESDVRIVLNERQDLDPNQQPQAAEETSNQTALRIESDVRIVLNERQDLDPNQQPQAAEETSNQTALRIESDVRIVLNERQDLDPNQQPQAAEETSNQTALRIESDVRIVLNERQDLDPNQQPQAAAEASNQMAERIESDATMAVDERLDAYPSQQPKTESSNQMAVVKESDARIAGDESQDVDPSEQRQTERCNLMAMITDNGDVGMAVDESQDADPNQQPQEETSNWIAVITDSGDIGMAIDESQDADPSQQPQAETSNQSAAMTDNGDARTPAMELIEKRISEKKETLPDESQQPPTAVSSHRVVSAENGWTRMSVKQRQDADPSHQLPTAASSQLAVRIESDARMAVNQMQDANLCQQPQVEGSPKIAAMTENGDEGMAIDHSRDSGERMPSRKSSHVHLKIGSKESWSSEHNIVVETIGQAAAVTENVENKVVEVHSRGQVSVDLKSLPDKHEEPQTAFAVNTESVLGEMPVDGVQPYETPSSSKSREVDLGCKNKEKFPSERQQSEAGTSTATAAFTETVEDGMKDVESQDADQTLLSDNSVEIHLRCEDNETYLSEQQQTQAPENSNQISAVPENVDDITMVEESQDPCQTLTNSGNQMKPQVETNKERCHAMAETVHEGMIVDQLPCSSKLMQRGSELLSPAGVQKTAASVGVGDTMVIGGKATRSHGQDSSAKWKTIKFYTRSLKGHADLVRCVYCRDSVLLSGG